MWGLAGQIFTGLSLPPKLTIFPHWLALLRRGLLLDGMGPSRLWLDESGARGFDLYIRDKKKVRSVTTCDTEQQLAGHHIVPSRDIKTRPKGFFSLRTTYALHPGTSLFFGGISSHYSGTTSSSAGEFFGLQPEFLRGEFWGA